ncbi:MAG: DUF3667 domain-containing protein [Phaeodactylibacter sp.]|uniref:DUF3667 domain-containing protein n=1 Tax=Phaeodactylibacter sp. TaxID=1940289 RepID=UPI0032F0143C
MSKRYCPNCYYPLSEYGEYCGHCSQKYTDGKVTFWVLIRDFFESVLNIDSKIFTTLGTLFIPGKLTKAYFRGQQKRYVPPMRLFFIMAVIHFAVLGFIVSEQLEAGMDELVDGTRYEAHYSDFRTDLDTVRAEVEAKFDEVPQLSAALDTLEARLEDPRQDSFNLVYLVSRSFGEVESTELAVTKRDLIEMPLDSLPAAYGVEGFWHSLQVRQIAKLNREGGNFTRFALSKLIWMVVLLMPALALVLKLLYIRRNRYYVEHLVFSFHYHAFTFLMVTLLMLGFYWFPDRLDAGGIVISLGFLAILFYLYKSMRRFYEQGRLKTFIKFCIINFAYLTLFSLFLIFTMVVTTLTF